MRKHGVKDNPDQSYQDYQDNRFAQGQEPHQARPFTLSDKAKTIIKIRLGFSERDCQILNTFCVSGEDIEYTLAFYDKLSRASLYRLLQRAEETFNPK